MVLIDTLVDLVTASASAACGALFAYLLNKKKNNRMSNQLTISRQELNKIKLENDDLLKRIQEKENLILKLQLQILEAKAGTNSTKRQRNKK